MTSRLWLCAVHVLQEENVAGLQMNLEGLSFPLGAEWVRQENACERQELCCVLVVMGISSQQWWLCQGWLVGHSACMEVSLSGRWQTSALFPVPAAFQQHGQQLGCLRRMSFFDHPQLEMAQGASA